MQPCQLYNICIYFRCTVRWTEIFLCDDSEGRNRGAGVVIAGEESLVEVNRVYSSSQK